MMATVSRRLVLTATMGTALAFAPTLGFATPPPPGERGPVRPVDDTDDDLIAYSTSFETDEPEWITTSTSYVTEGARTGERCLRYHREDSSYVVPVVSVPVRPGEKYELVGWNRTEGLNGTYNRGARIGMDAWGPTGWIGGTQSPSTRATDWNLARAIYLVEPGVDELRVNCHIYTGLTGTAWFDDLVLRRIPDPLLASELRAPGYRGLLMPGDHDTAVVRARVLVEELSEHSVVFRLLDAAGSALLEETVPAADVIDREFGFADQPVGRYGIAIELLDASGAVLAGEQWGVEKVDPAPTTHVDRHGRLLRAGVPFFPIGIYCRANDEDLAALQDTPFNTLLSYDPGGEAELDLAHAHGISVIYSLKDFFYDSAQGARPREIVEEADEVPTILDRVSRFRSHPALLAWYMADEPSESVHERLIAHHDAVVAHDPDHPTYLVHNLTPDPAGVFQRCLDIFGADSYPVRGSDQDQIDQPSDRARNGRRAVPNRGYWHVAQSIAWGALEPAKPDQRFPTLDESRNMAWQFLCQGATGLLYYDLKTMRADPDLSFDEAFAIIVAVVSEVSELVPTLLSVEQNPQVDLPDGAWLDHLCRTVDTESTLVLVNHTKQAQSGEFAVPAAIEIRHAESGEVVDTTPDGGFALNFASLDVVRLVVDLVTFDRLESATADAFDGAVHARGRAAGRRTAQWLQRASAAARRGDDSAWAAALAEYRRVVEDGFLAPEQAARLLRLSRELS